MSRSDEITPQMSNIIVKTGFLSRIAYQVLDFQIATEREAINVTL